MELGSGLASVRSWSHTLYICIDYAHAAPRGHRVQAQAHLASPTTKSRPYGPSERTRVRLSPLTARSSRTKSRRIRAHPGAYKLIAPAMTSCRQRLRVHEVLDGLSCQRCEQNAPGTRYEPWSRQLASSWHAFLTSVLSTTVRVARARIKLSGRRRTRWRPERQAKQTRS